MLAEHERFVMAERGCIPRAAARLYVQCANRVAKSHGTHRRTATGRPVRRGMSWARAYFEVAGAGAALADLLCSSTTRRDR